MRPVRAWLATVSVAAVLLLAGCGGEEIVDGPQSAAESEPVESPEPTSGPTNEPPEPEETEPEEPEEPDEPEETEEPEPPDPYEEYRGEEGFVTKADYGKDWPLKVGAGFLACPESFGDRLGAVIFRTLDGDEFALNGQAAHDYPPLRPIWANDREMGPGVKKSTIELIDDALDLCH